MTLDEAIKHCEEKAEELNHKVEIWVHCPTDPNWEKNLKDFEDCKKCAEEHEQLAEWLKELKARREADDNPPDGGEKKMTCIDCIHREVCYKYRLNYVCANEGTCTDFISNRPTGEWEDYSVDFYKCPECGYLLNKCCPQCYNKVILPKEGGRQ